MRHGSLFSGIGGFDLAAEWMGWENVFHCEWNPFGQRVLHHYWPNAETFTDITKTDFTKYHGTIDIISGGFPCQPYSSAGKRKGKEDERHLWPEMCRAIREISPSYVVGENVRGLTNWNGGLVFDEVCAELESLGYQVAPVIIPACAVNAPHRRERIWFVAYAESARARQNIGGIRSEFVRCDKRTQDELFAKNTVSNGCLQREFEQKGTEIWQQRDIGSGSSERIHLSKGNVTDTNNTRFKTLKTQKSILAEENRTKALGRNSVRPIHSTKGWDNFPTQSPICSGDDGLPTQLDGVTFSKWRNESIKAYGNAIVPQVAYEIFKAIEKTI